MTVTVTPTVELANWPPRVRLDVAADAGETSATVTRLDPSGATFPVRTSDGNPLPISGGTALLYDYEAPYGTPVAYSSDASPATLSAQITIAEDRIWLIHPGMPTLSMPIELAAGSLVEETYTVNQGVFWAMGRANPIVVNDGVRHGMQSTLTVVVETLPTLSALRALIYDAGVLLLNVPPTLELGVDTGYVAISDVKVSRPVTTGGDPWRNVSLPFYVVDRPAGGSQAARTWADVVATNTTWDALMSRDDTWADVLSGP